MDIYIPNIKLPKDEPGAFQVIVMYVGADGKLRAECEGTHEVTVVQQHGRLIDADSFIKSVKSIEAEPDYQHDGEDWRVGLIIAESLAYEQPTIIPADPAEEGET